MKIVCTFLFVLLCCVSIHCDSFYIDAAADGTSTNCSEATPCQSFTQVMTTFPDATAYDFNVAPGVYSGSNNVGLLFTVPVSIQPFGQGAVTINAGAIGIVLNATSSVSISGITILADTTSTSRTVLLAVNSLQPLTLQQVNLTTTGSGIALQVSNATDITLSGSYVTSAAIIIQSATSVTISNTVFSNIAYPAISLNSIQTVAFESSQFNLAEVEIDGCGDITLSDTSFNSPPNTYNNAASFYVNSQSLNVNNVSMVANESSQENTKTGLQASVTGNLTVNSFQLSGLFSVGMIAGANSSTITNIDISGTTLYAMEAIINNNFILSQFSFINCVIGLNYLGNVAVPYSSTVRVSQGTAVNTALFVSTAGSVVKVNYGEIADVQIISNMQIVGTMPNQFIQLSPGSWVISNVTAYSSVNQVTYDVIYGYANSTDILNVVLRGINLSRYAIIDSVLRFDAPALNLTITDSTFANFSPSTTNGYVGNILSGGFCDGAVIYIDNCIFKDSQFSAISTTNSTLVDIRNSAFYNIVYPEPSFDSSSTVSFYFATNISVVNTTFIGNSYGSGSLSITGTKAVISNCTFSGNVGQIGGAFSSYQSGFIVSGSTFTNNYVWKSGGAIYGAMYGATPVNTTSITDTTFTGNNGSAVFLTADSQSDSDNNWEVFVGGLIFNDNAGYAIQCVNGVTVEYQGDVTINGEDSTDNISGCTISSSGYSSGGNSSWVWIITLVAVIVIVLVILTIIIAIVAALVIVSRRRSSYTSFDDE